MGVGSTINKLEENIKEGNLPDKLDDNTSNNDSGVIPDDQFLCPKCDRVPEILSVHTDNGYIKLKCKVHGILELTVQNYYYSFRDSGFNYLNTKCSKCSLALEKQENLFQYCYTCKKDFCSKCCNDIQVHPSEHLDSCILVNSKNNKCLTHFGEYITMFCEDCEANVCKNDINTKHKGHKLINLLSLNKDYLRYRIIILEKNRILSNIIRFNNLVLNTCSKYLDNYYHKKSVINIGKSLVKENLRDSQDIECISDSLKDTYKQQEDAIITLLENNNIYITKKESNLQLRNKNLKDEEFRLISLIKFNQLQEINLSENNIKNIDPFRKMNLPYLEYLDMSNNKIVHVSPIAEINSKILKEIYLQNNEIYDFSSFLHAEFPKLELLRIDNNRFDSSSGTFQNLKSKYYNELIYEPKTFEDFNKKFSTNIEFLKTENINLTNTKGGNEILKELYNIIPFNNNIKQLILTNIDLSDTSVLIRLSFFNLEKLDLTLNNLTNIKFLYKMKLQNLKNLYLNDNKINDISALTAIEIPNIEIITLYHNNITSDDKEAKEIVSSLKQKNVLVILKGDE